MRTHLLADHLLLKSGQLRKRRQSAGRLRIATAVICSTWFWSCDPSGLTELKPQYKIDQPDQVPLIVIGKVSSNSEPAGPLSRSRTDPELLTRCWRTDFSVEGLIKGQIATKEITAYFFRAIQNYGTSGVPLGFSKGEYWLLFLQRDRGKLRFICDGWQSCSVVRIYSGAHPGFAVDHSQPVSANITRLLASRGDNVADKQMIKAIDEVGRCSACTRAERAQALKQVSVRESGPVRLEACRYLAAWGDPCAGDKSSRHKEEKRGGMIIITPSGMHDSSAQN